MLITWICVHMRDVEWAQSNVSRERKICRAQCETRAHALIFFLSSLSLSPSFCHTVHGKSSLLDSQAESDVSVQCK